MTERSVLPEVRYAQRSIEYQTQVHDASLPRVQGPSVFQYSQGNGHGTVESVVPSVGHRDLPVTTGIKGTSSMKLHRDLNIT